MATQPKPQPSEYEVCMNEWLAAHGIEVEIVSTGEHEGFPFDAPEKNHRKLWHDVYRATFTRTEESNGQYRQLQYVVPAFYQSAAHSRSALQRARCTGKCGVMHGETSKHRSSCAANPGNVRHVTAYDILSSSTLHDPGTFENFCDDFGYDTDSRRAMDVYLAVQKDWSGVCAFFTKDERAELAEVAL